MKRQIINIQAHGMIIFALALTVFLSIALETPMASAQGGVVSAVDAPKVVPSAFNGDVRNLPKVPSAPWFNRIMPDPLKPLTPSGGNLPRSIYIPLAPMPGPIQSFAGMNFNDPCTGGQCGGGWPPDPNGDVGLNYYIEAVNDAYAIYDKTGNRLAWFTENQLWANAGTPPCTGSAQGDPIVLYDQMADRWILAHLAFAAPGNNPTAPFYECIAVSQTSDPVTGGWWRYAVPVDGVAGIPAGTLNDYPKFGVWPDCIYMGANGFGFPSGNFTGTEYWSFSRNDMEKGATLTSAAFWVSASTNSQAFTAIPSNLRGNTPASLPAAGTPNYFVYQANRFYRFGIYKFAAGANCGATGSAMAGPTNVSELTTWGAPASNDVPQPGTSQTLDNLGYRLMQKVQYRKVGSTESLWINHTANDNPTNIYWAQLDVTGGAIAANPVQQGIHAPDATLWRWMGSIAADNAGNVALGYSTSNGSAPNYPSIRYAGRLSTDPSGQLPQSETTLISGTGSQTTFNRWGDYSAMSVDPADDCTFWYTNEYYIATGTNWNNRIGSFRFPIANCTDSPVSATPHTVIIDGGVGSSWKLATERLGTMPTTGTLFDYYATWDANNLYLGIKGNAEGNYTYVAVVDRDVANETVSNTGSAGSLACAAGFNLNGKGDFAVVRTGGTPSTMGSTSKQQGGSGTWAAWNPGINTDAKDWGRNMAAFQFNWADLALPTPNSAVGLYLYICNGATLISAWPPEDRQTASPILDAVTLFSSNASGATPRLQAKHKKDQTVTVSNGGGPFTALNGYVQLANVTGLGGNCSFNASVSGNTDFNDPQTIHRQYTLTPGAGCGGLQADLTLQYEDGTTANNAPSELGTLVENTLHVLRQDAGVWTDLGGTVNAGANTETVANVTQFSTFTLGTGAHPTAVSLSSFSASGQPVSGIWGLALTGMGIVAGAVAIIIARRR